MDDLSRALKIHLGRPESPYPRSRPDEVRQAFNEDMVGNVERLLTEVDALAVDWNSHTLASAMQWVEAEMRRRHPELSSETIADLGWAFSYWNK
ncbi:hypothetical protein [Sphingomonas psychrotolerans]|uniref:hypothetical protein n=1 Tax=Sphingomonas psychrotolerans TaxID=1327635 RepID=UPI001305411A|nr:hypothetical protein [Sphingomonas psychrotolerans]